MSEIVEVIFRTIKIVVDNPASILIVLGFAAVLLAIFAPIEIGLRILLGVPGLVMKAVGIYAHFKWLER